MWVKKGLVYGPDSRLPFATNSALTPTPVLLDGIIRVFAGFRDEEGVSRIGFVDLDADDPSKVLDVSARPALDIGEAGNFDDNGVILGDVVWDGACWRMYYVGFQKVARAKFLAFTGLATADGACRYFRRVSPTPLLDRSAEGNFIRAIHTALDMGGVWRVWYAAGRGWETIEGRPFPAYEIRCIDSLDGLSFGPEGHLCLAPIGEEYRVGRPRVRLTSRGYEMTFTKGERSGLYVPATATSRDGLDWSRDDAGSTLALSSDGWDSRTLCYPARLAVGDRTYLFYNGNDMGRDGFGYAEWMN